MLPRSQQLVILMLGLSLSCLWVLRLSWMGHAPPPPLPIPYVFLDLQGDLPRPGLRLFRGQPNTAEVWQAAGKPGSMPPEGGTWRSGTRVVFTADGSPILTPMSGRDLLTLGLPVDLNQASAADLEAVPGLGPVLAGRIVAHRQEQGPFKHIEDLLQVHGIGPKLLEKIRQYMVIIP